jgi:Holliday junction resolvasome RuvABC endonuclease subunit
MTTTTKKTRKPRQADTTGRLFHTEEDESQQLDTPISREGLTKDKVLALDIATKTGFATSTASGVWNLTPKKDESKGMRLIRFRTKLREMIQHHGFRLIVFEGAAVFSKHPNFVGAEMIGVCKLACEELGVDYMAYVPATIKKWATGNGHAGKPLMVKTARERWDMQSNDDNEADALAILHFVLHDLGLDDNTPLI